MGWRRNSYVLHRWLGLCVSLQLLTWSVSGFVFTLLDLDNVHGDLERRNDPVPAVRLEHVRLSPADACAVAAAGGVKRDLIAQVSLKERLERTVYELRDGRGWPLCVVDASGGGVMASLTKGEAERVALADFLPDAEVTSVELLEGEAPLEFRGGAMPVYRVMLDHPKNPHLYVSPVTGLVLKRRNRPWRQFDFLWMLHIMDYRERENFNHWLLTGFSALAILTSASGVALWGWRVGSRLRRGRLLPTEAAGH